MSNKTGFIYYNIDTDRYQDIRIKRLKKEFGCNGIAVYDYILCEVYRVKGCFLKWDDAILFDISEYFNLPESTVLGVVNYCCLVGLFEKLSFEKMIITSQSIQKRFIEMSIRAKRKDVKLPEECSIIPEKPPKLPEVDGGNSGSFKQSRVEDSKVKKSRVFSGSEEPAHWAKMVECWLDFYKSKIKDETGNQATPIFNKTQGAHLKKILVELQKIAKSRNTDWSEENAIKYLSHFFKKAWAHDEWMRQNFELSNLLSKFNSITNSNPINGINQKFNGKIPGEINYSEPV